MKNCGILAAFWQIHLKRLAFSRNSVLFLFLQTTSYFDCSLIFSQGTEEQTQIFSPQLELKHNWSPRSLEGTAILKVDKLTPLSTPRGSSIQSSLLVLEDVSHVSPSLSKEIIDCGSSDLSLTQSSLTVDDFSCSLCHRLVYRPIVLNCGEGEC